MHLIHSMFDRIDFIFIFIHTCSLPLPFLDPSSLTIGELGYVSMEDFQLFDKQAHFNRERIPERVVHAKGVGAHGFFEVTK